MDGHGEGKGAIVVVEAGNEPPAGRKDGGYDEPKGAGQGTGSPLVPGRVRLCVAGGGQRAAWRAAVAEKRRLLVAHLRRQLLMDLNICCNMSMVRPSASHGSLTILPPAARGISSGRPENPPRLAAGSKVRRDTPEHLTTACFSRSRAEQKPGRMLRYQSNRQLQILLLFYARVCAARPSTDATVVDLGLEVGQWSARARQRDKMKIRAHLVEGGGVQLVPGSQLEADGAGALAVPGGLGAGLDLAVDLVEVAGGEDAQVVGGVDGDAVLRGEVAEGRRVLGDGGLVDVVARLAADDEAVVAEDDVNVGGGALEQVDKGAQVVLGLLEVQVELGGLCGGVGLEGAQHLGLEALGDVVVKLELGVDGVDRGPALRLCQRWDEEVKEEVQELVKRTGVLHTGGGVVEVPAEELSRVSASCQKCKKKSIGPNTHVVGRLRNVGEGGDRGALDDLEGVVDLLLGLVEERHDGCRRLGRVGIAVRWRGWKWAEQTARELRCYRKCFRAALRHVP
ncbi:hypothetical protein FH972_025838 [Carpinus fangiana]|uniref:Uncharacterized protein n=1 Tax=Carpinus fangiana TaxID=176857 RepID=A0A5N6L2J7_9ROSI|nr:hypothetical protein FH972_025838 [Carpinus fangiana]